MLKTYYSEKFYSENFCTDDHWWSSRKWKRTENKKVKGSPTVHCPIVHFFVIFVPILPVPMSTYGISRDSFYPQKKSLILPISMRCRHNIIWYEAASTCRKRFFWEEKINKKDCWQGTNNEIPTWCFLEIHSKCTYYTNYRRWQKNSGQYFPNSWPEHISIYG